MTKENWEEIIKYGPYSQEFDWFAIDSIGNLGIFSAVMYAPIPEKVKESFGNYISLKKVIEILPNTTSAKLNTKEKGDLSSWIAYASKGLFAFDFYDVHRTIEKNQYDLIASPLIPLKLSDLNLSTELFNNLVRLDCCFNDGDLSLEKLNNL